MWFPQVYPIIQLIRAWGATVPGLKLTKNSCVTRVDSPLSRIRAAEKSLLALGIRPLVSAAGTMPVRRILPHHDSAELEFSLLLRRNGHCSRHAVENGYYAFGSALGTSYPGAFALGWNTPCTVFTPHEKIPLRIPSRSARSTPCTSGRTSSSRHTYRDRNYA